MQRRTKILATLTLIAGLVFAGAGPAFADHDAGIEGGDIKGGGECEYGGSLPGGPSETLSTESYKSFRFKGTLTTVCAFDVPLFVPECQGGCLGEGKGDWTAPKKPSVYSLDYAECFPPGTSLAGGIAPNGEGALSADRASIVFHKTKALLTCFWKDDPTDAPGYFD